MSIENLYGMKFGKIVRERHLDAISNDLVTYEYFRVLAKDLQRYEYKYPENWVEAVKERFLPNALRRYFPVKYKSIVVDVSVVYPELHNKIQVNEPHTLVVNRVYE